MAPGHLGMNIIVSHQTVDELFEQWKPFLGRDYLAYRSHAYRVFNLSCALAVATGEDQEKLALASAFHDIGIWLDNTFDYLGPSVQRAMDYLSRIGHESWSECITQIIYQHHKVFPWHGPGQELVESPCPRIAFAIAGWTPLRIALVFQQCRRSWTVDLGSIPQTFTALRQARVSESS